MNARDSRFSGNCGMFAIAVAEAAIQRGLRTSLVIAHNARNLDSFRGGNFHLYHVAAEVEGVLCDARGVIHREGDILAFMSVPPQGFRIDRFVLDGEIRLLIRRRTRWTVSFEKYASAASDLLESLKLPGAPSSRPSP